MQEILDIFGINYKLLLVQAFNFGVLLVALWYFLYRPVIKLLSERKAMIERGVRDAEAAEVERVEAKEAKDAILTDATREASILIERAKERGKENEAKIVSDAQARSEQMLQEARLQSTEEKRKVLESSKEEIARMVVLGAEKVLRSKN